MVTKEQLVDGFIKYIDSEVLPVLPTSQKWIVGSMVAIAKLKLDRVVGIAMSNQMISAIGIVQQSGQIDDELLFAAIEDSASKYGKLQVTIPFTSSILYFTEEDVKRLHSFIVRM